MDMAISCFGVTANDCLEGKCETVFDSFPDIMQFIQQLETIEVNKKKLMHCVVFI